ncbi:MAG: right-handed parallel beta-helix repeat-containing protein [Ignavibacteriales bacterium]
MDHSKYYRTFLLLLTIVLLTAYSLQLNATIRYVSKTGNSTPPYLTWETAADSIQECINICVFGDTIYVANGVYQEQVVMIPGLALIGAGTDSCIVDGRIFATLGSRTIEMMDSCLVKGFYILATNNFDYGYGIYSEANTGLITENKFSNANTPIVLFGSNIYVYKNYCFNFRRGIGVYHSSSIVRKNLLIMNVEGAAGIHVEASTSNYTPVIDSNDIGNVYDTGIRKFLGSSPTIKNNIINVKYSTGIEINLGGTSKVLNNLIINSEYAGINNNTSTNLLIYNNYIKGKSNSYGIKVGSNSIIKNNVVTNTARGIGKWSTQNPIVQYNNSWNNSINYDAITPDTTNHSIDPMVVNDDTTQGELDIHLQKYSPLIDAGDPTMLDRDSTRSDIGLYGGPYGESYVYVDLPPRAPVNLNVVVDTLIILNWNRNTEADFNHYNLYRDTTSNFQIDSTKLIASLTDTFYYHIIPSKVESLYFKLTAVDNQGNESNPSEEVGVLITGVEDEWKPLNNYILYQNYPNPFNPSTKISYKLKERVYVKLYVYDIKGKLVSVLVNQTQEAGYYEVEFNAEVKGQRSNVKGQLASGVYIYHILINGENNIPVYSDIKKMVYVK